MPTELQRTDRVGHTGRRYWRRLRDPLDEWWPKGWLLLAALFVLFFIGTFVRAPFIERDVRLAVVGALTEAGFEVVDAEGSGQRVAVRLSGVPDPQRVLAQARAVARGAECPTWFGPMICPTRIRITQIPIEPAPAFGSEQQRAPRYHDLTLTLDGARLQISGEVDSEDTKLWVLARVRSVYPAARESIAVSGAVATPMLRSAVDRGLALLTPLTQGTMRWRSGRFELEGWVEADDAAAVESAYAAIEPALNPQPLTLTVARSPEQCAADLSALFAAESISFASARAEIAPTSLGLLDQLAELTAECPGNLIVEGHTDDSGSAAANLSLSRRRAEAVREALIERGVSGSRLRAEGFGETRPIADNSTVAGRSRNRRIIIRPER